ncbi:hypothetical protein [Kistimonas scapharcae]|uniref:hypothetical protein n=1 Tax=Kistimonas scapharcae TaxID=1036133 RepID=UPI0031E8D08A
MTARTERTGMAGMRYIALSLWFFSVTLTSGKRDKKRVVTLASNDVLTGDGLTPTQQKWVM